MIQLQSLLYTHHVALKKAGYDTRYPCPALVPLALTSLPQRMVTVPVTLCQRPFAVVPKGQLPVLGLQCCRSGISSEEDSTLSSIAPQRD